MVSVKSDNVHYTDHTSPAAQALLTQVRPFRRAVFFYEEAEAITPDELRRTQDELKLIFDAPRREETANVLAEQIAQELSEWNGRAERVVLQLRPAGYPIPPAIADGTDLVQRVTRHSNPTKIVKAFLTSLPDLRTWHDETEVLHEFLRKRRLPLFQAATRLLAEIARGDGLPCAEPLATDEAKTWREALSTLVSTGRAASNWDAFTAALSALSELYRRVYAAVHEERDRLLTASEARLLEAGVPAAALARYRCSGLRWNEGDTKCAACDISLRELDLQITALPAEERRLRDQHQTVYRPDPNAGSIRQRVKYLKVTQVLIQTTGGLRITNDSELDRALGALRDEVERSLTEADAVELE